MHIPINVLKKYFSPFREFLRWRQLTGSEQIKEKRLNLLDSDRLRPLMWRIAAELWSTSDGDTTESLETSLADVKPGLNRAVSPEKWGNSVGQLIHFIKMCRNTAEWDQLAQSTAHGKQAGVVNLYQVCDSFVKPFSRGTGCGVSLLYNNDTPLHAEVMISHCWAEDTLEIQEAIYDLSAREPDGESLVIWFCLLANYREYTCPFKVD